MTTDMHTHTDKGIVLSLATKSVKRDDEPSGRQQDYSNSTVTT